MTELRWDLTSFRGRISPRNYFLIGLLLTPFKLGLDWLVAHQIFGKHWSPMSYALTGEIGGLFSLDRDEQIFYALMLLLSLPFLVVGLALTVRRLRDAGWPIWLVAMFFLPLPINLIFFLILCAMPSRVQEVEFVPETTADIMYLDGTSDFAGKLQPSASRPRFAYGKAFFSVLIPLPFAGVVTYLGTHYFRDYGWSIFVGLPFVLPMISVVIYGTGRKVTMMECQQVGWLWILSSILVLLVTAFEGMICIVMMLPIAIPIVLLGATLGYFIVGPGNQSPRDIAKITILMFVLIPTMVGAEHLAAPKPLFFTCETSCVINAPPEKVWKNVVSFSDLAPPTGWVFRTGLAYPIRARIEGTGVGAIRRCEFSTGTFVEPIEVWDEPKLLRFSVASNPPPMREWNPLFEIHPPHLDGFLVSKQGEFLLTPLPDGKTLLKGSTLYQHGLWPASYWRLWSDPIIHRIHDRVLQHIKTLTESE